MFGEGMTEYSSKNILLGKPGAFDDAIVIDNRKNDLTLIMTPEKQDKTLELSKHWFAD